jgi:hypothetical protein
VENIYHHPFAIFGAALVVQWLGAWLGHAFRKRAGPIADAERSDFTVILGGTLTLLALIIGFTFSMAATRYDGRKDLEEAETNAIDTEYERADLLPAGDAARVRDLLTRYARERIQFYEVSDPARLRRIHAETVRLEADLWSAVTRPAVATPTPVNALAVSGMNEVLDAEGSTRAAWRNHIPLSAWALMIVVAFAGNLLLGASEKRKNATLLVFLPVVVSVPFFLIADIDSPRAGIIRVIPVNLNNFVQSLKPRAQPIPLP